jgi:Tol biopolymer transport system component
MSRRPLILALLAVAVVVTASVLPAGATPFGDNGKIVFERPTPNGSNLFTVNPNGSKLKRLTGARGYEGDSAWSEDGTKVAFSKARNPDKGPFEIWVVNADGSGLKRLTRHHGLSIAPAWSPDGLKIAYATDEGKDRQLAIWVMNVDGSDKHKLKSKKRLNLSDPQWSGNGTRIAFAMLKGNGPRKFDSSIAIVNAFDGSAFRRLTSAGGPDELNPNWAPQGEDLAFERTKRFPVKQSDLALIQFTGTQSSVRRITTTKAYETNPTFAPDGTRIAFTGDRDNRGLSKDRLGRGFEVYTMKPDGSDIERVTKNRKADLFPDWQPLGR